MQPQDPQQPNQDMNSYQAPAAQSMPQQAFQPMPPPQQYTQGQQQQPMTMGPRTNVLAILSLVLGIVLSFIVPIIGPIVGAVLGFIALSQIKTSGESGRGLAIAGIIVSGFFMLCTIAFIILWIVIFSAASTLKPTTTSNSVNTTTSSGSATTSTSTLQSQTATPQTSNSSIQ